MRYQFSSAMKLPAELTAPNGLVVVGEEDCRQKRFWCKAEMTVSQVRLPQNLGRRVDRP